MDKMALADRFEGYSQVFASDSNMGIDLKAMADTLREMPEEKFAKVINADFEEEAMFGAGMGQGPSALSRRQPLMGRPGYGTKVDPAKAKMIAEKYKLTPDQIHEIATDIFEPATGQSPKAPAGQITKSASDLLASHIAKNLVRDVLGMDKSICCDTKRHLDKKQMPDATKTQETKGAVARQEDTGAALKPEQVPHLDEKLNSDMYKKSQGKVRKEATTTEDKPDTKAAEPQDINAKEDDKAALAKLQKKQDEADKAKKQEELKATSRPDKKDCNEEVEANTIVAEGIEFDNVMMEADANDEDVKKLSALFE